MSEDTTAESSLGGLPEETIGPMTGEIIDQNKLAEQLLAQAKEQNIVTAHGYPVAEAPRMGVKPRRGVGKSDAMDAHQIAATTLGLPVEQLRRPRLSDGVRQSVRILVTARESMSADRTP